MFIQNKVTGKLLTSLIALALTVGAATSSFGGSMTMLGLSQWLHWRWRQSYPFRASGPTLLDYCSRAKNLWFIMGWAAKRSSL